MAIQIHIRIRDSDYDAEEKIAGLIADEIDTFTLKNNINVPVLILPVEDPEHEMEDLIKEEEGGRVILGLKGGKEKSYF